jgi:prephenate dehydrogenase
MWGEILLENRREVIPPLRESAAALLRLADLLKEGKADALAADLEEAQARRNRLGRQAS